MNNFISFDKWELPVFTLRVINDSNMMLFGDIGFKCPKNQGFVLFATSLSLQPFVDIVTTW